VTTAIPLPGPLRLPPSFPFVGRSRELRTLRALLPEAVGEGRRVALVAGEAGSGKSRLVRELAATLAPGEAIVLYGACDPVVQAPYGAVVEALEHLVRHTDAVGLPDAGELRRLLPSLATAAGEARPAGDVDTERHRLHVAVTALLTAVSTGAPVVLLLEDVHWADPATLVLLRHLVRAGAETRMLVVVTYRDPEANVPVELVDALADLHRAEGVVRIRLGGLSDEEVARFVCGAAGVEAADDVTAALTGLTEGNPFLVTELWRELLESRVVEVGATAVSLTQPVEAIGTPESVREVVSHRLARLPDGVTEVLELAAVAGPKFTLQLLRGAGVEEAKLLDGIDAAARSGLLLEVPSPGLTYRFAHELVRRSVSDRLSSTRRAELHLAVAEAIESTPAREDPSTRLAVLAHHFAAAAPIGGVERAVAYNLAAAGAAADALALEDEIQHLRVALGLGIDDPDERGRAWLSLGYAFHRAGNTDDGLDAFREAARLAREVTDGELLARAAIGFEETCWRPGIHDAGSVDLLEEAEAAIGPADSETRALLLGGLARALDFRGEYRRAAPVRDEAIAMARRRGDRSALGWMLSASYWSRGVSSNQQINEMLAEALEIGEELGDGELRTEALAWLVPSHVVLCDHDAARDALERLLESARITHQPFHLHVAEHYASALALCDGDLTTAEAAAARSRDWSRLLTGRDASGVHGIQMFGLRREQGRLAELAPAVRLLAAEELGGAWRPGLVVVLAELGMSDEARRELDRIRTAGLDTLRPSLWTASLLYLADACALVGDGELAAALYAELRPYSGENMMIGHLVACFGAADRYLGMLATALGELDLAEAHFEQALELNRRLGARTWVARTSYEYARMLLLRSRDVDRARVSRLLGEAVAIAEAAGLHGLTARVRELDAPVEPDTLPDGLSAREADILRLVARGLSNRDVGRELFISEHTVANHVRSILRKTGCANRTEAAAYALRRGLVPE
jgi:DNA-binding CsgD family transcriptional regulator/tetratricopeptide (TPR) repeat protein